MPGSILESVAKRPVVCDGAMGTLLQARGVAASRCIPEISLTDPHLVLQVHRDYLEAGAQVLETNTFGANRVKLTRFGCDDKVEDINRAAVRLAREVAGDDAWVAGSVGPIDVPGIHLGYMKESEIRDVFREQIGALVEEGVDLLMLETFSDLGEMQHALTVARNLTHIPVIGQFLFEADCRTQGGLEPSAAAARALKAGADLVGANCGSGPLVLLDVVREMASATGTPVSVLPNAGFPEVAGRRTVFVSSPDYFAKYARRFLAAGARMIGGCCGTTPQHIRAMAEAVAEETSQGPAYAGLSPRGVKAAKTERPQPGEHRISEVREGGEPERAQITRVVTTHEPLLKRKLGKKFIVTVELNPPRGLDYAPMLAGARLVKYHGADAVNIADNPLARVRMSPLALAHLIKENVGIDVVLHMTCRDRNLLGLQSDLMGASALGVDAVLALRGDPSKLGDYPEATSVFDVSAEGLVRIIANLNRGLDWAGNGIGVPTSFLVGVAVNPLAESLDEEIERLRRKAEAGADFALTQPIYDVAALERFFQEIRHLRIPIVVGILPLSSGRHAEFLHNEVPGITVAEEIRRRMSNLRGKRGRREGITIAREFLWVAKDMTAGAYLSPAFERYETAVEIMDVLV